MKSVLWMCLTIAAPTVANAADVAVILDGPSDYYERTRVLLKSEYDALVKSKVTFPEKATFVGDHTTKRAKELL
ncbi:MAG: hypothetical protein AAF658_21200, partial [Myxococcota bacterium]